MAGSIDVPNDTVRITIPPEFLPTPSADREEVVISPPQLRAGFALRPPVANDGSQPYAVLAAADTASNAVTCDVVLYE